jgi:hypothetical protein
MVCTLQKPPGARVWSGPLTIVNPRAYTHDPDVYSDPLLFKPERFLGPQPELDPQTYVWGFGRRVCPGRVIADYSIWFNIAATVSCFTVSQNKGPAEEPPSVGLEASEARPDYFVAGTISHPAPFNVDIRVRSQQHAEMIRRVETEDPWGVPDAEDIQKSMPVRTDMATKH